MSAKQKILFVIHQMNIGGVQKSLLSVLDVLDYERFEVTLYVRKNRTELLEQVNPNVKTVVVNEDPTRYYRKPRAVFLSLILRLCTLLHLNAARWKEKLDRFVIEGRMQYEQRRYFSDQTRYDAAVSYIQGYSAEFVARYVNADKKIVFFHGSEDELHTLHEAVFPSFDRIVAVNAGCRDLLRAWYPAHADRIGYIDNYVDAGRVRALAAQRRVDRHGAETVFCTCGRMTAVKGFDLAVEAAALLRDRNVDFVWFFVGDGPERASLEAMTVQYGLQDRICFTGMLDNPYPYISGCDIYVQPSRAESYGLSIAEAQILGRPVVSTKTVGGESLISDGKTGFLVDCSALSIANCLTGIMIDKTNLSSVSDQLNQIDYAKKEIEYSEKINSMLLLGYGEAK